MKGGSPNRPRFLVEAALFGALIALARIIPRRWLLGLGALLGSLGHLLDRRHRRIGLDNLRIAYGGELDGAQARRLLHRCWRHFGRITLDALKFPRISGDNLESFARHEGLEHLHAAYARGRGVLLFSGHFGHWELTALAQGFLGLPLALVTRPLDNPRLERMLAELRGVSGNRIIHKRNAIREMLRALNDGIGVAIVIDQDARDNGVFVPFFGRPASTTPSLALLALRTGAALVPTYSVPEPDGRYRIVYEPAVEIRAGDDRDADVIRLTSQCTAIVERWVREHPELWLWMHRRWKTVPPPDSGSGH